jgi:hypothetical protein
LKRVLALGAIAVVVAGCGGSPSRQSRPASPKVSPASFGTSLGSCRSGLLPSGFTSDQAHTGRLTAQTYSASADVQAALSYDQLQSGARRVFTYTPAGSRSVDGVASCVSLSFASAPQAARFFGSYQTLRRQAKSIVHEIKPPAIAGLTGTTAYLERQQSFRGYGIASTNVVEIAGLSGQTLLISSVAGAKPSRSLATNLLESMVSH